MKKLNSKQERFCLFVSAGEKPSDAYALAGYSAKKTSAVICAHKLMHNENIVFRLDQLREKNNEMSEMSRKDILQYLVEVLKTPIGEVDENHYLAQKVTYNKDGSKTVDMYPKSSAMSEIVKILALAKPDVIEQNALSITLNLGDEQKNVIHDI